MKDKTLRDEFAIAVFPTVMKVMDKYGKDNDVVVEEIDVAKTAYNYADAMLKARGK